MKMNSLKIPAGVIQNIKEALDMPEVRELLLHAEGIMGVKSFVANSEALSLPPPHVWRARRNDGSKIHLTKKLIT